MCTNPFLHICNDSRDLVIVRALALCALQLGPEAKLGTALQTLVEAFIHPCRLAVKIEIKRQ